MTRIKNIIEGITILIIYIPLILFMLLLRLVKFDVQFSLLKIHKCPYPRRHGHVGKIMFGYNVMLRFNNRDII